MHKSIHIADGETHILAGLPVSPSGPPLGPTVNVIPFPAPIAALGLGDTAGSLDADVFAIGELAVRLVGSFSLPRIYCERLAADPAWEGEEDRQP